MQRFSRAVFVALVAATFAAFFVAQRLKSSPPVATLARVTAQFSPNGDGRRDEARIAVRVRKDDDVTVTIVDELENEVTRLARDVPVRAKERVRVRWDGTTAAGRRAPDAVYHVRVSLRRGGRAVTLRPGLRLDTAAPRPTVLAGGPDGSGWITGPVAGAVPFRVVVVSERRRTRVRVLRTDQGAPREVARLGLRAGEREGSWDGRAGGAPAPPGTYQIVAAVRDLAGNVGLSAPPEPGVPVRGTPGVSVRALLARPPADAVRAGDRAPFAVDSRGRPYRWAIRRVGEGRPRRTGQRRSGGELRLRVPRGPSGLYVLELRAGRDATAVPFAVQGADPAPILVVLPALTWFGRDELDDDRDGFPNTLDAGGPAAYPRLLAGGLPDGFTRDTAALLAFLDAQKVHYDIATDLTLAASRSGLTGERAGVLLAGPLRWVPTDLARRLRRYAAEGGRVATFGADTLRRGVAVTRDALRRPLPAAGSDPFGTRLRPPRRLPAGADALAPIADEGATGLLTGIETLPGFSAVEESAPSPRVQAALAAAEARAGEDGEPLPGTDPVFALTRVGDGFVIRAGLPEWGARLRARSVPVQQLTRNVADLLRGARPRIRSFR